MSKINRENFGRIAVFYPWPYLGGLHSLCDAATILADHGYDIDIYTFNDPNYPQAKFANSKIKVISKHPEVFNEGGYSIPHWLGRFGWPLRWFVSNVYRPMYRALFSLDSFRKRHSSNPYICFIGMDPEGLVNAHYFSNRLNIPLIYWSLELLFSDEIKNKRIRDLKEKEITYSRNALFSITFDKWRAKALADENQLKSDNILMIPNAPMGNARRFKNSYLHDKFNIDVNKKIILMTGHLHSWTKSLEIVKEVNNWSPDYVLVLHSTTRHKTPYIQEVISYANQGRVYISFDPLSASDYEKLIDSADVGLAFYSSDDNNPGGTQNKNLKLMGYSSGKINTYLKHGLPIIVNSCIGPDYLIQTYNSGVCVKEPSEIGHSLDIIFQNYETFVSNACHCFEEELQFNSKFLNVLDRINKINDVK